MENETPKEDRMTEPKQENYHEGRPIIRTSSDHRHVTILCPVGHVHTSMPLKEWAGSWLEAKASDKTWTVKCRGALPAEGAA